MDYLSALNAIALPEYQKGIIDQRINNVVLLQRLKPRIKKAQFDAGGNLIWGVETMYPIPGGARVEAGNMPTPGLHTYSQESEDVREVTNVAGISQEVMERLGDPGSQSFIDMPDRALKNCGRGMDVLLNIILHGDSTGRLAQVSAWDAATLTLTVDNTRANFGWAGTAHIVPGMRVDVKTWADGTDKVVGATVVSTTATTITLGATATYGGTINAAPAAVPADDDIVFVSGSATWGGDAWTFNLPNGLLNLIDDGATVAGPGAGANGSWAGATLHGLDRTTAAGAHLAATILKADDWGPAGSVAGTATSWDLDVLEEYMDAVEHYGSSGGQVTALYMTGKTERALKRKAQMEMNVMTTVGGSELIPGRTVPYYNYRGRKVPVITIPTLPEETIIIADENQITWHEHVKLGWYDGYATKPWFPSPAARNLTYEAWMRTKFNLTIGKGSAFVRLEDLNCDE